MVVVAGHPRIGEAPYTHQEIFETLLDILIKQSMYPPNFTSWRDDTDDDEDDFKDFRDKRHGMQDVLLICCHALREKFFDIAAAFMFKVNPGHSSHLESFKVDGRWQEMESAVFVLHNCMDAVKGWSRASPPRLHRCNSRQRSASHLLAP